MFDVASTRSDTLESLAVGEQSGADLVIPALNS